MSAFFRILLSLNSFKLMAMRFLVRKNVSDNTNFNI